MVRVLAREPTLFGVFVGAALTAGIQFGLPISQGQANALTGVVVAGLAWWVRASVVSPESAVLLARDAATKTAERLTEVSAGVTGQVTDLAGTVVDGVVGETVEAVGGLVGRAVTVHDSHEPESH